MTEPSASHSDDFTSNPAGFSDTFWFNVFQQAPHAMALASADGLWVEINNRAQALLPASVACKGQPIRACFIAEDQPLWDEFWATRQTATISPIDLRLISPCQGRTLAFQLTQPLTGSGTDQCLITLLEHPESDELVHAPCREQLNTICNNIPALIGFVDNTQHYRFCNKTYTTWFGLDPEQLVGSNLRSVLDELAFARAEPHIKKALKGYTAQFENEVLTLSGYRYVSTMYVPHHTQNGVDGFHVFVFDITDRKALEDQLSFEATHDPLTSLPNRRALTTLLRHALARRSRSDRGMALIYLDLDHFTNLNIEYGQEFGDMVLQHVARILIEQVRQTDIVARWEGDEFIVALEGLEEPESDALSIAGKILTAMQQTRKINRKPIHLAGCIGISTVKAEQPVTLEELISAADHAMHQAKSQGRNQTVLHPLPERMY